MRFDAERAIRLAAFAQTSLQGSTRQQFDRQLFDTMLDELRTLLDDPTYHRVWNEGVALTFEEAARLALAGA